MTLRNTLPNYRLHRARNLAVTTFGGRDYYLGAYGSLESYARYQEVLSTWIERRFGTRPEQVTGDRQAASPTVALLMLHYWRFAEQYYRKHDQPTDEQHGIRAALRYLRALYGHDAVDQIRPSHLKRVRDQMIAANLSRKTVNQYVERIKRMFRWGVENELVRPETYHALAEVAGLKKNRSAARENQPVLPVAAAIVTATLPELSPVVQAMVQIQYLTGCRPGEICVMRPCDIDRTGEVWCYRPHRHKTDHLDHERRIYLGSRAQAILALWLQRDPTEYCFSPRENARPARGRSHARGSCYSDASYRRAITRACARARVAAWSPNQLRHSRATELREFFGLEAAQTVLGHSKADVTQIYAERDFGKAAAVMGELG